MVEIRAIKAFRPKDPETFAIKPYDVINKEEELNLKKNPNSAIHLILPEGKDAEIYSNAEFEIKRLIEEKIIVQDQIPSVFLYRQESDKFSHEGLIFGVSIQDYKDGYIKRNEHTREIPLNDRISHITSIKMNTGLVWTAYKKNRKISSIIKDIKKSNPIFDFHKYGYRHLLWKEDRGVFINELKVQFKKIPLYIADGHHRTAAAAAYRDNKRKHTGSISNESELWDDFMVYAASDHQIRILPYNRVIKKLNISLEEFKQSLRENFKLSEISGRYFPKKEREIGMFLKDKWYKLVPKVKKTGNLSDDLDVSILQNYILNPILNIKDIRKDDNVFFVGGITDPGEMESYVTIQHNDIFFSLYPISVETLEKISDLGEVMPPKSTWFDPKLLTGLLFNPLT